MPHSAENYMAYEELIHESYISLHITFMLAGFLKDYSII